MWIIIFGRENYVYSFSCCSFLEKLYTRFQLLQLILEVFEPAFVLFYHTGNYLSTVRLTNGRFLAIRFFPVFLLYFFTRRKRGFHMDIDLKEELRKRDELLAGYLKQIEIQEKFIQKQKELIEYLEDHISKITDIVSGV